MLKKQKPIRNERYKKWIRGLPCLITGYRMGCDAHHVPKKGYGSLSKKTDDTRCIPLRHDIHMEAHRIGKETFAKKYGLDYEDIITRLNKIWEEYNDRAEAKHKTVQNSAAPEIPREDHKP